MVSTCRRSTSVWRARSAASASTATERSSSASAKLDHLDLVGKLPFETFDGIDLVGELLALAHHLLGAFRRAPQVRSFGRRVQLGEAFLGTVEVKDASSAG